MTRYSAGSRRPLDTCDLRLIDLNSAPHSINDADPETEKCISIEVALKVTV